jgi:Flp pilus assembly secretin CpaC
MSPKSLLKISVAALMIGLTVPAAPAADPTGEISVMMNMARILRIPTAAATVIIGNPAVADVTIQDPLTLVLTGKSYGRTNLIALDQDGNPIADMVIAVTQGNEQLVTVYWGMARTSLDCAPDCQPVMMVGDDTGFTAETISSANMVEGAAN